MNYTLANKQSQWLSLTNELGQIIHIDFSDVVINPSLSADIFTLDLGSDFDVIR